MLQVKSFTFGPFHENTYVVYNNTQECIIIDPGCYDVREESILKDWISEQNLSPQYLVNTHAHIDHIMGNQFVCDTYGLKPMLHEKDLIVLTEMSPRAATMYGLVYNGSPLPEKHLQEGDIISLGKDVLRVLHTPGHAPGHIVLVSDADEFVINGDVLFQGSIGRTDLPLCNYNDLETSIRTKLYTLPDQYLVYTGHGNPTKIGVEKRSNPFVSVHEYSA
jgi:hydroxyacylglutathione hydrolase